MMLYSSEHWLVFNTITLAHTVFQQQMLLTHWRASSLLPVVQLKLQGCTVAEGNTACKNVDNYVLTYLNSTCHTRSSTTAIHTEVWLIWAVIQGTCAVRTTPLASFGSVTVKHSWQLQTLHIHIILTYIQKNLHQMLYTIHLRIHTHMNSIHWWLQFITLFHFKMLVIEYMEFKWVKVNRVNPNHPQHGMNMQRLLSIRLCTVLSPGNTQKFNAANCTIANLFHNDCRVLLLFVVVSMLLGDSWSDSDSIRLHLFQIDLQNSNISHLA